MSIAPFGATQTPFRGEDPYRCKRASLAPFSAFALVSGVGAYNFAIQ
jgi:hypothetical protein